MEFAEAAGLKRWEGPSLRCLKIFKKEGSKQSAYERHGVPKTLLHQCFAGDKGHFARISGSQKSASALWCPLPLMLIPRARNAAKCPRFLASPSNPHGQQAPIILNIRPISITRWAGPLESPKHNPETHSIRHGDNFFLAGRHDD